MFCVRTRARRDKERRQRQQQRAFTPRRQINGNLRPRCVKVGCRPDVKRRRLGFDTGRRSQPIKYSNNFTS